ncbi:MAG: hypothetical protein NZ480_01830 [Bdellovibrionaceae bacterium]|nr:hypothetical protein [Pseudobdellovibrionaceae bacterium]MDW8190737.1 hypothetical protein [Pseudobdellovibrionaceae bacterium]
MKKWFGIALTLTLLIFAGCESGFQLKKNKTFARKAGETGTNLKVEAQAEAVGLKINWELSEIVAFEQNKLETMDLIKINDLSIVFNSNIEVKQDYQCTNNSSMNYQVRVGSQPVKDVYYAIGYAPCYHEEKLYLGISVMGWNSTGFLQQFILLSLTDDQTVNIEKQILDKNNSKTDLIQWISQQFTK